MTTQFILYSTSNCHLCDDAELLLNQANLQWETIEISENDELLNRYGLKIPVLQNSLSKLELCWPFSLLDVQNFCKL